MAMTDRSMTGKFEFQTNARIPFPAPVAAYHKMCDALVQLGLEPEPDVPAGAVFRMEDCEICLDHDPAGVLLTLGAVSPPRLQHLRDSALHRLSALDPVVVAGITWSKAAGIGTTPPGFRRLTFLRRDLLMPGFARYAFRGSDLGPYWGPALHLRMLVPRAGQTDPEWPVIGPNGATKLPTGEKMLAVRYYTVRHLRPDPAEDGEAEIELDVLEHGDHAFGGWAMRARAGDVIGAIGPVGGVAALEGRWLLMGGDPTALPAIARIFQAHPDARGRCVVTAPQGAEAMVARYLAPPPGMDLQVLPSDADPQALVDAVLAITPPEGATVSAWFAAEAEQAKTVRAHFRGGAPFPIAHQQAAAYWHRAAH